MTELSLSNSFDTSQAVEFLKWLKPQGPWDLVAIRNDPNQLRGQRFFDAGAAVDWIKTLNDDRWNAFVHVGELDPQPGYKGRARKKDVTKCGYCQVDVDPESPPDGVDKVEWLQNEQSRILAAIEGYRHPPTRVIFTGGGYHALWQLESPVEPEEAESRNRRIAADLGGDREQTTRTFTVRLAGSVNWPNKTKIEKGRVPENVIALRVTGQVYPIDALSEGDQIEVPKNIDFMVSSPVGINDLPAGTPANLVSLIAKGVDSDRSEAVLSVANQLIKLDMSPERVYGVLINPENGISKHILEQSDPERAARRAVRKAIDFGIDPKLADMNEQFAVIRNLGGKCRVIEEMKNDSTNDIDVSFLSKESFLQGWEGDYVPGKDGKPKPLGAWWWHHPNKRKYNTAYFLPGVDPKPGVYNLWRGWGVEPVKGDAHERYLTLVRDYICSGDPDLYEYVIKWMARAVQVPMEPAFSAIVLRSGRGTGKGVFSDQFGKLFGRHYMPVTHTGQVTGRFDSHLKECLLLFADEAFFAGDPKNQGIMNGLITEETKMFEQKNVDIVRGRSHLHIIIASNSDWVIPAGPDERRYLVLDIKEGKQKQNQAYFKPLLDDMNKHGGRSNLLYHLLHEVDLTGFDVRKIPQTKGLTDQKLKSLSPMESWWYCKLQDGELLPDQDGWPEWVQRDTLLNDYLEYAKTNVGGQYSKADSYEMMDFLKKAMVVDSLNMQKNAATGHFQIELRSLEGCRAAFNRRMGGQLDWGNI